MDEIKAYRTKDGKLFEDYTDAIIHENKVNLKTNLYKFIEDHGWNGMSKDDFVSILYDNYSEIKEIFSIDLE